MQVETTGVRLATKSLLWAASEIVGNLLLTFGTMMLLARLMQPEQYGTGALVLGGIQAVNLFVGGLFHDALIQNPDTNDRLFETALSLVLLISLALLVLSLAGATVVAGGRWAEVGWLTVGAAAALPFAGAGGIASARARRDFDFRSVARTSMFGRIIGCLGGVAVAALGFGAWGLVAQYTLGIMAITSALFQQTSWRPRLRGRFRLLWPTCRFALPYAVMHSLNALRAQGFLMLITAFMGLAAAGSVSVAFRVTVTPLIVLTDALVNLGLPLLSRHQSTPESLRHAFAHLTRLVSSITLPAFIGLALTAPSLVPVVLGARWSAVTPLVQVLAVGAALNFLRFPISTALRALGFVRYSFASSSFQLVVTLVGMLLLWPHAQLTAVLLWVLPTIFQWPCAVLALRRVSTIGIRDVMNGSLAAFLATISMSIIVTVVNRALQDGTLLYRLFAEVAAGGVMVLFSLLLTEPRAWRVVATLLGKACPRRPV